MMTLKKLKSIVQRELKFKGNHIPYEIYSKEKTIKNCKNEYLKKEFKKWYNVENFLTALYNLSIRLPSKTTIDELKEHLNNIEYKYKFDINYFDPNSKYYLEKVYGDDVWRECLLSIHKVSGIEQTSKIVSVSKLKEYLTDNPNLYCYTTFCFDVDKKTMKKLIKDGLVYRPNKKEKQWM